jgi:hypothetical protein
MNTNVRALERLSVDMAANFTRYWTGLMKALSRSSEWMTSDVPGTAPRLEAVGRQVGDVVADYARGLIALGAGRDTAAERAVLSAIGTEISANIERMRESGPAAYVRYGEGIAAAAREAARATTTRSVVSIEGFLVANAVAEATQMNHWDEVGETAAAIGKASAFGAAATAGIAVALAAIGMMGTPLAVATLILAGAAAFGDRLCLVTFAGCRSVVDTLASWLGSADRDRFWRTSGSGAPSVRSLRALASA